MLDLLDCRVGRELGREGEEGEGWFTAFGKCSLRLPDNVCQLVVSAAVATPKRYEMWVGTKQGLTLDTLDPFRQLVQSGVHCKRFDALGPR